jgi:hypothetical protein
MRYITRSRKPQKASSCCPWFGRAGEILQISPATLIEMKQFYWSKPNTVNLPSVATNTLPFTTSGTLNLAAASSWSRVPA